MQTIGKIINGKYVRYGAVSVGDKLGDAAFANIVNNATTTEEGFVPDARVVAQQQQIITQQQEQIDSLNSAIESISGSDTTALTSQTLKALKSRWESLPNSTIDIMTFTGTSASALASCVYFKLNNEYGCAIIMSYYIQRPVFVRLYGGNWYGPMRI